MLIKCKQCGLQVPAGIYRLKLHIAGIRGQVNIESLTLIEVLLRRGASSAGGSAGPWPLASIDDGCRVRDSGQARVRDANISWAVGFGHGPVAQGPV